MMKKNKLLKTLLLLTVMLVGSVSAWAGDYVLKASSFDSDKKVCTVDGLAFTFDPAHGGTGQTGYGDYIKLSKNKTYTITLPNGFNLTNINIKGYTNSDGATNGEITSIGGNAQTGKTFPARNDANLSTDACITNGYDFSFTQTGGTIAISTANTNQIAVLITITGTPATPSTEAYKVTFDAGSNGSCATTSLTEESAGAGVILPSVTANNGYKFNGWYTEATEGTKVGDAGETYKPTKNTTLYAQYSVVVASDACELISVKFSNGAYGSIATLSEGAATVIVPYLAGESEPTVDESSIEISADATTVVDGNTITVTAEDGTTTGTYTITKTAYTPLDVTGNIAETTFTEVPSWIYNPYGWDEGKGVKFAKDVNEAGNMRISKGNTRQYYFIGAAKTLTLTSGSAQNRNINVYRNGVKLASPTKTAATGSSIEIALDESAPCMIMIESINNNGDGGFTKYAVTVASATVDVTGVTLDETTAEVEVGKTVTLTATVAPADATNKNVTWASDDEDVATVENGVVTGVAEGIANITVTTEDGNKTATCVVTVVAATPSTGGTAQFKFTAKTDWNGSNWQTVDLIKATFTNKAENTYVKFAKNNTLTLEVVGGSYAITNVKLGYADGNAPKDETITTTVGTMNIAGTEWNGVASELVITNSATSSNDARVNMLEVTYVQVINTTIGSTGWSTFCSDKALDFTGLDVKAYMVTGVNGTKVEKVAVNETVPANTPLLLNGVAAAAYSIPVVESSETSTADNKLVAGTGDDVSKEAGYAKYVMVASDGKAVFKKIVSVPATVPVGKAYLKISEEEGTAPMFSIDGDDDTTGINSVERGALRDAIHWTVAA